MEMKEKLKKILSKELICEIRKDGIIKYISENCLRILGYSKEEMMHKHLKQFMKEEVNMEVIAESSKKECLELNFTHKDGKYVYMSGEAYLEESEDDLSVFLQLIDISKFKHIEQKEKRLRSIIEKGKDLVYRFEIAPKQHFSYVSPSVKEFTGYTAEEHYDDYTIPFRNIHPEERGIFNKKINGELDVTKPIENRFLHRNGKYITMEEYIYPIYDDNNNLVALEGVCRNIQQRKELEEQLVYMSYHDILTDVYNRTYFEQCKEELNEQDISIGLIVCDLDNLKNVNDSLGHEAGDKILKGAATLIRKTVSKDDLVARIGGDEFIILLKDIEFEEVDVTVKNIKKAIQEHNLNSSKIPIHMSIGFDYSSKSRAYMEEIFRKADQNMYKIKQSKKQEMVYG